MSKQSRKLLAALLPVSGCLLCTSMIAQASTFTNLPLDRPTRVSGITTACTGIGQMEESNRRWQNYPVKLEAVNRHGQYLADEDVTLRGRNGDEILRVRCDAPWVLMRLQPGRYDAVVSVANARPKQIGFAVPRTGQRDVIVRFSKDSMTRGM